MFASTYAAVVVKMWAFIRCKLLDVNYLVFIKRLFELNCFRSRRAFIIRTICTTGMYSNSYKQFNVLIQFIFL